MGDPIVIEPFDRAGDRPSVGRLKRRAEFLHVAGGSKWHGKALSLQARARHGDDGRAPRFGFTLTKKVGNAVVRNRARRRLREAVRLAPDLPAARGHDYVVVGRLDAVRVPFEDLQTEIGRALAHVRDPARQRPRGPKRPAAPDGHGGNMARDLSGVHEKRPADPAPRRRGGNRIKSAP